MTEKRPGIRNDDVEEVQAKQKQLEVLQKLRGQHENAESSGPMLVSISGHAASVAKLDSQEAFGPNEASDGDLQTCAEETGQQPSAKHRQSQEPIVASELITRGASTGEAVSAPSGENVPSAGAELRAKRRCSTSQSGRRGDVVMGSKLEASEIAESNAIVGDSSGIEALQAADQCVDPARIVLGGGGVASDQAQLVEELTDSLVNDLVEECVRRDSFEENLAASSVLFAGPSIEA